MVPFLRSYHICCCSSNAHNSSLAFREEHSDERGARARTSDGSGEGGLERRMVRIGGGGGGDMGETSGEGSMERLRGSDGEVD